MTQLTLDGSNRIIDAIRRLIEFEPENGYDLAFSGGKDSIVCYDLAKKAGVKFRAHYSMTTIDPPAVTKFIRETYPDVIWKRPIWKGNRTNFYNIVAEKGLPNRRVRWCCDLLKESDNEKGSTIILGVRREESAKRSERPLYQPWGGTSLLHPIYDWTETDVWDYIHLNNLAYPSVYDEGQKRVGCIMCPLACRNRRIADYLKYPAHVKALERAVGKFLEKKPDTSLKKWGETPEEIVHYWVYESPIESAKGTCMQAKLTERWD